MTRGGAERGQHCSSPGAQVVVKGAVVSTAVVLSLALITTIVAFCRAWWDHRELKLKIRVLEAKADEMKKKIQLRGQLAGEIAHEIKNPITAIQCSAETLELMLSDQIPPELSKSLRYIREYSDYLLRLLSDFLEVSRCEAGVNLPRPEVINLGETVEAVTGLLRSYAMKKHIIIEVAQAHLDARVWADSRHVKQILFNLIHNALKFTPDNGKVAVEIKI